MSSVLCLMFVSFLQGAVGAPSLVWQRGTVTVGVVESRCCQIEQGLGQRTITSSLGQECGLHCVATLRCARTADASKPAAVFPAGVVTAAAQCQAVWWSSPSRSTQLRHNVFDVGSFVGTAVG